MFGWNATSFPDFQSSTQPRSQTSSPPLSLILRPPSSFPLAEFTKDVKKICSVETGNEATCYVCIHANYVQSELVYTLS